MLWTQPQNLLAEIGYLFQTPLSSFLPILALFLPSLRNYAFDRLSSRIKLNCRALLYSLQSSMSSSRRECRNGGFLVILSWGFEIYSYMYFSVQSLYQPCIVVWLDQMVGSQKRQKSKIETSTIVFIVGSTLIVSISVASLPLIYTSSLCWISYKWEILCCFIYV